jgi:hypothetical protein
MRSNSIPVIQSVANQKELPEVLLLDSNTGFSWQNQWGNGSGPADRQVFSLFLTSKTLMQNAYRAFGDGEERSKKVCFAIDATFKLDNLGYSVIIGGVTDLGERLHDCFYFISSHRMEAQYDRVIKNFKQLYQQLFDEEFTPSYTMGDADDAQRNALEAHFPQAQHQMCYFHVVKKIRERLERVGSVALDNGKVFPREVYKMIANCHFALNENELNEFRDSLFDFLK